MQGRVGPSKHRANHAGKAKGQAMPAKVVSVAELLQRGMSTRPKVPRRTHRAHTDLGWPTQANETGHQTQPHQPQGSAAGFGDRRDRHEVRMGLTRTPVDRITGDPAVVVDAGRQKPESGTQGYTGHPG